MIRRLRQGRWLLSVGVLAVMLAAIATAGYIYAQNQERGDIYTDQEGDERVVAVVNGINVGYGDVRKSPGYWQDAEPGLTEEDSFRRTIVGSIDRFVLLSEIEKRGLMPTEEEGLPYMTTHKGACEQQQHCLDLIAQWGETFEEHWARVAPSFRENLGVTRLNEALLSDGGLGPRDGASDERADALTEAIDQLRSDAKIEWKDDVLERYYKDALAAE
jgi:hypothetical protein